MEEILFSSFGINKKDYEFNKEFYLNSLLKTYSKSKLFKTIPKDFLIKLSIFNQKIL